MGINKTIKELEEKGYKNIFIWSDTKGVKYDWHSHPYEEIRIILKGEMIINTKNETYQLKKRYIKC
jgi:quercetin dioxygenase-like cupin family protein